MQPCVCLLLMQPCVCPLPIRDLFPSCVLQSDIKRTTLERWTPKSLLCWEQVKVCWGLCFSVAGMLHIVVMYRMSQKTPFLSCWNWETRFEGTWPSTASWLNWGLGIRGPPKCCLKNLFLALKSQLFQRNFTFCVLNIILYIGTCIHFAKARTLS